MSKAKKKPPSDKIEYETPLCCRCREDFPVATEPAVWQMGQLRPLKKAPAKIKFRYKDPDGTAYLCGNCFFDLTDD